MWNWIANCEPVAVSAAIRAVLACGMAFGLGWSAQQLASVMLAVESVFALFVRARVTPTGGASTPSIKPLIMLLLLAGLTSSCALNASTGKRLQQVDVTVYTAIAAVDDVEMTLYKTGAITEASHRSLNPVVLKALKAGRAANDALSLWPRGDGRPPLTEFKAALDELGALAKAILDFTPEGPAREALKAKLDLATQLVRGVIIGLGGTA